MSAHLASAQVEKIVKALSADGARLREVFLSAWIDALLDQELSTVLDATETTALISAALTGENVAQAVSRHVRPGWDRHVARCEANGETLGDSVPDDVRRRLGRLLTETKPPRARWADDVIDGRLLRQLLSPVVQQTLLSFARNLPIPGVGSGGGGGGGGEAAEPSSRTGLGLRSRLKATVEKRAERVVEAGRSALGGLGAEVERQIQGAARDFSDSASREFKAAFSARLSSDEGRDLARQIVTRALDRVLDTPLSAMNADVAALPMDELWALLPPIAEHNRSRGTIVDAVREELEAVVAVEGGQTLRALLDEAGLLDDTVSSMLHRGDPIAKTLFQGAPFRAWLSEILTL